MNAKKLGPLAALVIAGVLFYLQRNQTGAETASPNQATDPGKATASAVVEAWKAKRSNVWLESAGEVTRLLKDDMKAPRHQLFLLRVDPKLTVLVSHNIDLAKYIPVAKGDRITLRGRYEHNAKGGVIHWTHHDPKGRREGGWIEHKGKVYK